MRKVWKAISGSLELQALIACVLGISTFVGVSIHRNKGAVFVRDLSPPTHYHLEGIVCPVCQEIIPDGEVF